MQQLAERVRGEVPGLIVGCQQFGRLARACLYGSTGCQTFHTITMKGTGTWPVIIGPARNSNMSRFGVGQA